MTELLLFMGKLMPEEKLIEDIKDAATEYGIAPSKETKQKLLTVCMILLAKQATEGKDIMEVAKEMGEVRDVHNRLTGAKM